MQNSRTNMDTIEGSLDIKLETLKLIDQLPEDQSRIMMTGFYLQVARSPELATPSTREYLYNKTLSDKRSFDAFHEAYVLAIKEAKTYLKNLPDEVARQARIYTFVEVLHTHLPGIKKRNAKANLTVLLGDIKTRYHYWPFFINDDGSYKTNDQEEPLTLEQALALEK